VAARTRLGSASGSAPTRPPRDSGHFALARAVQFAAEMTRFDRTWEPLVVLVVAAIVWFGTL